MSRGRLLPFPACGCVYAVQGHCVRDEVQNPGYDRDFACPPLERLMKRWDGFIDYADSARLEEEEAFALWERREGEQPRHGCPLFRERAGRKKADRHAPCPFLCGNACVLRMPLCRGVCAHFRPFQNA